MAEGGHQAQIFAGSEADRWFDRNQRALASAATPASDLILRLTDLYDLKPASVLEVGASNGYRLAAFAARGSRAVGVEPSAKAIADGRERFPAVELRQGLAGQLPVTERFDLVIVNFVFHWVDRPELLRVVSEVDRCVADGGHLFIGDFLARNLTRREYHHLPGSDVHTYKQDYSAVFLASGLYRQVALLTSAYSGPAPKLDVTEADRAGTWLLQKSLRDLYTIA